MVNFHTEFQNARERLHTYFIDRNAAVIVPSPYDLALSFYRAIKDHTAQVRREQEEFQQNLQALGIDRLSRLPTRDVVDICSR